MLENHNQQSKLQEDPVHEAAPSSIDGTDEQYNRISSIQESKSSEFRSGFKKGWTHWQKTCEHWYAEFTSVNSENIEGVVERTYLTAFPEMKGKYCFSLCKNADELGAIL